VADMFDVDRTPRVQQRPSSIVRGQGDFETSAFGFAAA